jgi:ATP-dependent Clp protease ATP-binding subunit ClpC
MFERYTVKARQTVFFARYAASQLGSPQIEIEHLLLGVLRADIDLATRLVGAARQLEPIRERIEKQRPAQPSFSTSIDVPVSEESKRALTYAAEEAALLHHQHIGPEHLLLGMLRLDESFTAQLLRENGITPERLREEANRQTGETHPQPPPPPTSPVPLLPTRNLTLIAEQNALDPLVGREREIEFLIAVLARRTRRCPALIGEPGVGKSAIVVGLAHRISNDLTPHFLQGHTLLSIDATQLAWTRGHPVGHLERTVGPFTILCVEGLFDCPDANHVVVRLLFRGARLIGTGTAEGFRRSPIAQYFHPLEVCPLSGVETEAVLNGLKDRYEEFHNIPIHGDVIPTVMRATRYFPTLSQLPERAIDVLDEACARAKVRRCSTVTPDDVEAVMAARTGAATAMVSRALDGPLERNKRAVMTLYSSADVQHIIAEGNLVMVHRPESVKIFRLDDAGMIVEHWEVAQPPDPPKS